MKNKNLICQLIGSTLITITGCESDKPAAGYRSGLASGSFRATGNIGWWRASTISDLKRARNRTIAFDVSEIARGQELKRNGYSVRCVKN
jgi:hypothetical protein